VGMGVPVGGLWRRQKEVQVCVAWSSSLGVYPSVKGVGTKDRY
jgi:hypothetical protein